jgi:hypothetical protein
MVIGEILLEFFKIGYIGFYRAAAVSFLLQDPKICLKGFLVGLNLKLLYGQRISFTVFYACTIAHSFNKFFQIEKFYWNVPCPIMMMPAGMRVGFDGSDQQMVISKVDPDHLLCLIVSGL